jgi:hypothetical protein
MKTTQKKKSSCNRPWRPIGFLDVEDPTLSRQAGRIRQTENNQ